MKNSYVVAGSLKKELESLPQINLNHLQIVLSSSIEEFCFSFIQNRDGEIVLSAQKDMENIYSISSVKTIYHLTDTPFENVICLKKELVLSGYRIPNEIYSVIYKALGELHVFIASQNVYKLPGDAFPFPTYAFLDDFKILIHQKNNCLSIPRDNQDKKNTVEKKSGYNTSI